MIDTLNGSIILPENKKLDASYRYYLHGPLARMELGDQYSKVQGIDYAYTLQGWLKGVNGNLLNPNTEIGHDGQAGNNNNVAQDAYAYSLSYHYTDYKPIGTGAIALNLNYQQSTGDITGQSLYNGNIANTTLAISTLNSGNPVGYSYHYDQLNSLKQTRQHNGISGATWNSSSITNAYAESYNYDGNGNLLTQTRNGSSTTSTIPTDNLTYNHNYTNGHLTDNKLNSLQNGTSNYTYTYDQIGERTSDSKNGLTNINWTVYGKIKSVSGTTNITYTYNPAGQRITKTNGTLTTYYVRDAEGNTLALYDNASGTFNWREQHLYGSSRIGIWTPGDWRIAGMKAFELTDHRDNVVVTISDRRIQYSTNSTTVAVYQPDVLTASDTYSFGYLQAGRQYGAQQEYGYNGKENDNDIGNSQNYGMREYDLYGDVFESVDPLTTKYPWLTPYQFASDRPIDGIDQDGLEFFKKDNSNYLIPMAPVLKAPTKSEAVGNVFHNTMALMWNGTIGGAMQISTDAGNAIFVDKKEINGPAIVEGICQDMDDIRKTPIKDQIKGLGVAATDWNTYSILPQLALFHTLEMPPITVPTSLPEIDEALLIKNSIQEAADEAESNVPKGKGPVQGTKIHSEFKKQIAQLKQQGVNVSSEISYLNGRVVKYGTKGSVRADVVVGDINNPTAVYDLKTGGAKMSTQELNNYKANLPGSVKTIEEIKPR